MSLERQSRPKGPRQTFEEKAAAMRARLNPPVPLEVLLTVGEAAKFWGQSESATRRYFATTEGVQRRVSAEKRINGRKRRRYVTILIPPSVLERELSRYRVGG